MLYTLRVIAILFTALATIPAGAHLLSMASKLKLDQADYLASQRAYDGWSLLAIVVLGALLSTFALAIVLYREREPYLLATLAFLCIVGTQVIFWTFTFPANQATQNWTALPVDWETLRLQWEVSHAASAILNLAALTLLAVAAVKH